MSAAQGSAQIVVSTDGHAGADVWDYKPYLERRYHEEFDRWAASYVDPWGQLSGPSKDNENIGFAAYDVPINWDSEARVALLDELGIASEVLFPNTAPPFIPSGEISAPPPRTAQEYEYRFAGIRAHNRWMADFCAAAPDRRIGLVQVFLNDLDRAIEEIRWGKEHGLKGVLLPSDHLLQLVNIYEPTLDRLWAVCAELELPVHRHQVFAAQTIEDGGPAAPWIGMLESRFYAKRAISHVLCAAVFEKFPTLKFVCTELDESVSLAEYLATLDQYYELGLASPDPASRGGIVRPAVEQLARPPSDYFRTNCFLGGPLDVRDTLRAGTPNVMFGADVPHTEGPGRFTRKAIRATIEGLDDDTVDDFLYRRAVDVYGLDVDALQAVADRIGPRRDELQVPVPDSELPSYPDESRCLVFKPLAQARV